jgi:hypothetical protein
MKLWLKDLENAFWVILFVSTITTFFSFEWDNWNYSFTDDLWYNKLLNNLFEFVSLVLIETIFLMLIFIVYSKIKKNRKK